MKPKLKHYEGSYAVVSLETGKAVAELDKNSELLDKINTRKYKLVPIGAYLAGLNRKENPMKRKPTPAQIAARERFAEMAKSGAFKKKAAKRNPRKKTVSEKISQLTREGYPQKQAVAIALSEERAGKVKRNPSAKDSRTEVHLGGRYYGLISKNSGLGHYTDIVYRDPRDFEGDKVVPDFNGRYYQSMNAALRALERYKKKMILENPRASNPIILVSDKPIASKRKRNPINALSIKYACIMPEPGGMAYGIDERTPVTIRFSASELKSAYKCYLIPAKVRESAGYQRLISKQKEVYMSLAELKQLFRSFV